MIVLKNKIKQEKKIYVEIFLKAQEEFFIKIDDFKKSLSCKNCQKCCKIIYTNKTPNTISQNLLESEKKRHFWNEFLKVYIPFGIDSSGISTEHELDMELNQAQAAKVDPNFVDQVNQFECNPVFYYCKNFVDGQCSTISNKPDVCKKYPEKLLTVLHKDCAYLPWQSEVNKFLRTDLSRDIYNQVNKIDTYREKFKCNLTGTCCRLSSSEFSYEELLSKAEYGDNFAKQFTSIFIPYKNTDEARKIFPEYVDYVLNELGDDEKVYFYHCPHIDENNLCTIYTSEKRPKICADFPNNPLTILFPHCGYIQWKKEVNAAAMLSHAMIEICTYTLEKLERIKLLK